MEQPQAFLRLTRRARKEHRCCECLGTIRKGESYTFCSGIWDNEPASFKTCPDCIQLRFQVELTISNNDDGMAFGELMEFIQESKEPEWADAFGKTLRARETRWKLGESSRRLFSFPPGGNSTINT
jgi:hypothetical protein